MSKYELVYFDGRGRGEQIRLAFIAAKQTYTDRRVPFDDWPKVKPEAPQGRLPYLVINGKDKLSQSLTILRYIADEHDLNGSGSLGKARVDEVVETCVDLFEKWEKAFFVKGEKEKQEADKALKEEVPKFYNLLENLIKGNTKNGYAVGSKVTIADCSLFNIIDLCGEDKLKDYPSLEANRKKVKPLFEAYLKDRKGQF